MTRKVEDSQGEQTKKEVGERKEKREWGKS